MALIKNKDMVVFLLVAAVAMSATFFSGDATGRNTGVGLEAWDTLCSAWPNCQDPANATVHSSCQMYCTDNGYDVNKGACKRNGSDMMCCCYK